ncbi:MAG: hypothetical protein ACHQRO_07020, partial [Vicinamibacteria bacterium]
AALGGWLLLGAVGCQTRTGDEMEWGPISTPPWTVGGAKPGMTPDEVERLLGPPTSSRTSYGRTTTQWAEIFVTFDLQGRAEDVMGDRLTGAGGKTLLQRGDSEAEVVGRLGAGRHKGSYRPGGSGVISCTMKRVGGEHVYEDATTRYTISIYEDRLASVRAQPLPVSKR